MTNIGMCFVHALLANVKKEMKKNMTEPEDGQELECYGKYFFWSILI